jgi:hypothetical protein
LIDEAFISTAQTKEAVNQHLELINQKILRATPAVVDIEVSVAVPLPVEIRIPAGTKFTLSGPDNTPVNYEIFRTPGDFTSSIVVPPGKRGIIAHGVEGIINTPLTVTATGGPNQFVDIVLPNVLDEPIRVDVNTGSEVRIWQRVDIIEKSDANDEVYEVKHLGDTTRIQFGNDRGGKAPLAGQLITVIFRTGGGVRGRIAANTINETRPISPQAPVSAAVEVLFRNPFPSSGGTDEETIEQAKNRAPREFATQQNAVTGEDYGLLAKQFRHPVFGAVAKAIGTLRTGVDQDLESVVRLVCAATSEEAAVEELKTNFINRNIVELYVLAEGPGNVPVLPSTGLKQGLITFFEEINVLTDEVRVFNGAIKPINVTATVVMSRNADAGTVKAAVQLAITEFFDINNFDMSVAFYLSNLYNVLQTIPGVRYIDIFDPADDIIQTNKIADPASKGIGFNEVITLGEVSLKFFFEPGNFKVPPVGK